MDRFLRAMSHDPAIEICFISQIISMVINSMIDFSQPLFPALWQGGELVPGKVIVIGADRDRAAAIQRYGIITRWTDFGELRICTGYLQGQPHIRIALSAEGDGIEFAFL